MIVTCHFWQCDNIRLFSLQRPYFELKDRLEFQLQQEKLNVEDLVRALLSAKVRYKGALATLEAISEEVHMKRKASTLLPPRTPGVGAENASDINADLPSINLGEEYLMYWSTLTCDAFSHLSWFLISKKQFYSKPFPMQILF